MIKDFLNKHSDDAISIATISIIVIAIIIVIITWIGGIKNTINSKKMIDTFNSYNYIDLKKEEYEKLLYEYLKIKNSDKLYKVIDKSFLQKNNIEESNFKNYMLSNNYIGNSIAITSSKCYISGDYYIFSYSYDNYNTTQYVSVVESMPGEYYISFGNTLESFDEELEAYYGSANSIECQLNIIESTQDHIKYVLTITNESNFNADINYNDINTFALIGENVAYNVDSIVAQDITSLSSKSTYKKELVFSISPNELKECDKFVLRNVSINGKMFDVEIPI